MESEDSISNKNNNNIGNNKNNNTNESTSKITKTVRFSVDSPRDLEAPVNLSLQQLVKDEKESTKNISVFADLLTSSIIIGHIGTTSFNLEQLPFISIKDTFVDKYRMN
mgnify:CR=1 FL=1